MYGAALLIGSLVIIILDILKKYNIKATFFCVGKNIENNPEIFERIKTDGHSIGNHSYSHQNGWLCKNHIYLNDIQKCQDLSKMRRRHKMTSGNIKR